MNSKPQTDVARHFSENVRTCREFLGMTADDLAKRSGMTPAAISQIENGKREPMLSSALKIAHGLGASLQRLCEEPRKK